MIEWLKQHQLLGLLTASGLGSVAGAGAMYLWQSFSLWWFGSRWSIQKRHKHMVLTGDSGLRLGGKRFSGDTVAREGDKASTYYRQYWRYVYKRVDGKRIRYRRSMVEPIYGYYQWKSIRGVGENLMNHFIGETMKCVGLEERKDAKGSSYWAIIPVADVYDPELPSLVL